jgi:hypothetical protein
MELPTFMGCRRLPGLPDGYQAEVIDLEAIADNPAPEFAALSRDAKELIADEYPHVLSIENEWSMSRCQNCGRRWSQSYLAPIRDLSRRVSSAEPIPSGECPVCGTLCHTVRPS